MAHTLVQANPVSLPSDAKFILLVVNSDDNIPVSPPLKPNKSGRYVVDTGNVDWSHTIFCWRNRNSKWRHFSKEGETWTSKPVKSAKEVQRMKDDGYFMKTTYYFPTHQVKISEDPNENSNNLDDDCGVRRVVTQISKIESNVVTGIKYALIEYLFPENTAIALPPKRRSGQTFIPTAPSIKIKIQDAVQTTATPTEIAKTLSQKNILEYTPGSTPRGKDQISYYRRMWRKSDNQPNKLKEILNYGMETASDEPVVRCLQVETDSTRFVFAMSAQLDEIVRNCSVSDSGCGILVIDSMLEVGDFLLTPTYYTVNAICDKRTKQCVVVPGPCLFQENEMSQNSYMYFAHSLLQLNYDLLKVQFIAGDRGEGQADFALPFYNSILIPCCEKMKKDIKDFINSISASNEVIADIFGTDDGLVDGLIHCPRGLFDEIVNDLIKKWPATFVDYFKNEIMDKIKNSMLLDIRETCGLSKTLFSNNPMGYIHKKMKTKIIEKQSLVETETNRKYSCTLKDTVDIYKELVLQERDCLHQAICGLGPYELARNYKNLGFDEIDFALLSSDEKKAALSKVVPFMV